MDYHYYAVYLICHNHEVFIGYFLGSSIEDIEHQLTNHHNYRIEPE